MHSSATLPMMLPLRMRNQSENDSLRAQEHYAPFRPTPFSRSDEGADRGPGSLYREEWNAMATRAQRRDLSLYKTDRDVNPTIPPAVDAVYRANETHDLAPQLKKRGNIATTLQSPTPRFSSSEKDTQVGSGHGPGEYSPERFTGAFPLLTQHVTPLNVRQEKQLARHNFDRAFAIAPLSSLSPRIETLASPGKLTSRLKVFTPRPESTVPGTDQPDMGEWRGLESAPLKPALTPKNVYSHRANRELVLQRRAI